MKLAVAFAVLFGSTAIAGAHVTLKTKSAEASAPYVAAFHVGHGCLGSPTVAIRVRIPAGVVAVEPEAKAGWSLVTKTQAYAKAYDDRGTPVGEGITEVAWTGGSLPDGKHGEFVLRAFLTKDLAGLKHVYFPVVQECAGGKTERWIEIPADGKSAEDYESPAPGVSIAPKD